MGKNKIHIQVALLALLVLLFCVYILMFNEKKQLQKSYYQYHIGVMHIDHPILVEFVDKDMWYVCPDSVLYCECPRIVGMRGQLRVRAQLRCGA